MYVVEKLNYLRKSYEEQLDINIHFNQKQAHHLKNLSEVIHEFEFSEANYVETLRKIL